MDDKRIRIGVDNTDFDQYQSKMRQSAESLARDMIRSARGYTTSAKEVLTVIDEQIKAIEKRNRLDDEFRKQRLSQAVGSGEMSKDDYSKRLSQVTTESREDKLQTQILKDILDSIKHTSKEEIREDRINVEKNIQSSSRVGRLSPEGDEFSNLKETIQQAELNRLRGEESIQRGGVNMRQFGSVPSNIIGANSASDLVSQGSIGAGNMMAGMKGGLLGAVLAITGGTLIKDMAQLTSGAEQNVRDYSILSGVSVGNMGSSIRGSRAVGRTGSETLSGLANLEMVGKTGNFGESGVNLLNAARGTMLSESDIGGMAGLRRYGGSEVTPLISYFNQYLKQTGQSVALLPDIIQSFTNDARQIISETGRVDTKSLASMYGKVGEQTGFTGELLTSTIGSLRSGMKPSGNAVMRALQMRAARSVAKPGSSVWEVEKIMHDPSRVDYMGALMGELKDNVSQDDYERILFKHFGIAPNLTSSASQIDLAKEVQGGFKDELGKKTVSMEASATKTLGAAEKERVAWTSGKEDMYYNTTEAILEFFGEIKPDIKKISNFMGEGILSSISPLTGMFYKAIVDGMKDGFSKIK